MPRPWGTDDGMTQLGTPGLQKDELLKLFSMLPLRHLPGPILQHKHLLTEGDRLGKAFGTFTGRG
jgi:hypothetical protein